MEEPDFWDVPEKAQEQMKELGDLKESSNRTVQTQRTAARWVSEHLQR